MTAHRDRQPLKRQAGSLGSGTRRAVADLGPYRPRRVRPRQAAGACRSDGVAPASTVSPSTAARYRCRRRCMSSRQGYSPPNAVRGSVAFAVRARVAPASVDGECRRCVRGRPRPPGGCAPETARNVSTPRPHDRHCPQSGRPAVAAPRWSLVLVNEPAAKPGWMRELELGQRRVPLRVGPRARSPLRRRARGRFQSLPAGQAFDDRVGESTTASCRALWPGARWFMSPRQRWMPKRAPLGDRRTRRAIPRARNFAIAGRNGAGMPCPRMRALQGSRSETTHRSPPATIDLADLAQGRLAEGRAVCGTGRRVRA